MFRALMTRLEVLTVCESLKSKDFETISLMSS